MKAHIANEDKNGRETNPVISEILGIEPERNKYLEEQYKDFCRKLGFEPNETGAYNFKRKFWDVSESCLDPADIDDDKPF